MDLRIPELGRARAQLAREQSTVDTSLHLFEIILISPKSDHNGALQMPGAALHQRYLLENQAVPVAPKRSSRIDAPTSLAY